MPLPPLVDPVATLSDAELRRTARHASLSGLGEVGQRRLAAAHVAIVGAGGLGSPVVLALAAAGVGTLTVIDDDVVEAANLQRQVLHRHADIGADKVDSAVRASADLSPETRVVTVRERLDAASAARILTGADLVVDTSDTLATRADVAAAAEELGLPVVWGVVQEFHAQVTVFWSAPPTGHAPVRLADLHDPATAGEPPSCAAVGVLGALCLQVGGLLAVEAIKLIAGIGESLLGRVLVIDALRGTQREVPLRGAADAVPAAPAPHAVTAAPTSPPSAPPAAASAPRPTLIAELTVAQMLEAQEAGATLLDVREPWETQSGIVAGSVVVPLQEFLADPGQLGDDEPVVVICAHGVRARHAAMALRARGVDASILAGGLAAWTQG
ncbi:ThiF family adenylyltransferase [Microbacterium telephonicum]|uniref:Adenylyltransferase/sulfurtransferase n=1 Tax=Microbacterium telephonicum TaxID=1714841 RepID=A0A498CF51_9MICO|nr:ThiF family adenylyltransferase [Microbacterium telephonicum]RLK52926.1 adenylyltransferase/sulfurtransferase [Microbacterium telephonicum]